MITSKDGTPVPPAVTDRAVPPATPATPLSALGAPPTAVGAVRSARLFGLEPGTHRPHAIHAGARTYPETDCYADVIIELVHARGDEPLALLGNLVRLDFEGDQWTFFKPDPRDLETLFGIDIHEMQPYRSLPDQIVELLASGRTMSVELDAWSLPDTAATSYRREHVKTTVVPEAIDLDRERLIYFHNATLAELIDADFRAVFRLDAEPGGEVLPPYTELIRFDAGPRLVGDALRAAARETTRYHLARLAPGDPMERFAIGLARDLPRLLDGDAATYHAYAFATVRLAGAGFELLADHVDWLCGSDGAEAATALRRVVETSKMLGFKLARRRTFDPTPALEAMSTDRALAVDALKRVLA
ncbi:MAG: DUF1839 family protein [Candidatus Limnocylindrales bacterium]